VRKKEYLAAQKRIGQTWQRRVGRHFPAITLVEVSALLESRAKLELEATAVL
jgi:enamine deaminase RidA (YjgF/YER057c/UK114 family)